MRLYRNCREMHSEVKRDLHEMGILVHPETMQDRYVGDDPNYRTLELSPCVFTILDGSDRDDWLTQLGANLEWARAELNDRWSALTAKHHEHLNPGRAWTLRRETWEPFLHGGRFAYTYGERFNRHSRLAAILYELDVRPDTRQAVLPVFSAELDTKHLGGTARVPCSMHYQFLRRPDGLRCFYVMRSTDFITHFPYDIWLALSLQERIASECNLKSGHFTFFSGSLHIYAKDADPGVF